MITTIFLVIYFTFILTATINFNSDLIPLWIIISPVFAIFIILILIWIMTPLYKFSGKNNRFFSYVTRSASKFINMFLLRMKLTIVGSEKIPKDKNIEYISKIDFDLIVSSPLMRALQTSLIIGEKTNYKNPIVLLHEFVERDFGKLDYTLVSESKKLYNSTLSIDGFESNESLEKRVNNGVIKLNSIYTDKKILLVAHSHIIKALMKLANSPNLSYSNTEIDHKKVTEFEFIKGKLKLIK